MRHMLSSFSPYFILLREGGVRHWMLWGVAFLLQQETMDMAKGPRQTMTILTWPILAFLCNIWGIATGVFLHV